MSESNSMIRFKVGAMEVEFEGSEDFMKEFLPGLISNVLEQYENHKESLPEPPAPTIVPSVVPPNSSFSSDMGTSTIASITKVGSGSDLIMAAATCLTLTQGAERMSRLDMLKEMRAATSYYKETYNSNLSKYLDNLVKADRLRLISKDTYAMSAKEREAMVAQLATG